MHDLSHLPMSDQRFILPNVAFNTTLAAIRHARRHAAAPKPEDKGHNERPRQCRRTMRAVNGEQREELN
jgi:hypothetical protein